MKKNELKVINEKVAEYLKLKVESKRIDIAAKALKSEHIDVFADSVVDQFDEENSYVLDQGVIKLKNNPPKLVHESGKALSSAERQEFCNLIAQEYVTLSPSVSKINTKVNADKHLKKTLKANGIAVVQDSRYDVVPA